MMSTLPTISKWPMVRLCPASVALPQVTRISGEWAERGTNGHEFLADVPVIGRDAALAKADERWRSDWASIDLDAISDLLTPKAIQELALAIDLSTGKVRTIGTKIGRNYEIGGPIAPTEIVGSLDVVIPPNENGIPRVADWKFGWGIDDVSPRVADNWQLWLGALCVARHYGVDQVAMQIVRLRFLDRPMRETHFADAWALADFERRLNAKVQEVEQARADVAANRSPTVTPCAYCDYCAARAACPSTTALVRLAADDAAITNKFREILHEDRRKAYHFAKRLRSLAGAFDAELHAMGAHEAFPIDEKGETYFGAHEVTRDALDGIATFRVLQERYGLDAACEGVEMKASKAGIKRAARAAKAPNLAAAEREVLAALDARGGVEKKKQVRVEEFKRSA